MESWCIQSEGQQLLLASGSIVEALLGVLACGKVEFELKDSSLLQHKFTGWPSIASMMHTLKVRIQPDQPNTSSAGLAELYKQLQSQELDESGHFLTVPAVAKKLLPQPPAKLFIHDAYTQLAGFVEPGSSPDHPNMLVTGMSGTGKSVRISCGCWQEQARQCFYS